MCPGRLYRVRRFEMNPTEDANVRVWVEGAWEMLDAGGNKVFDGKGGSYTLVFRSRSATSLSMVAIDPDPGGGTAE